MRRAARAAGQGPMARVDAPESVCAGQQAPQRLILEDFPSPAVARTLSPNGRAHWAARSVARRKVADRVAVATSTAALMGRWQRMPGRVRATFRFVRPNHGRVDLDNLTTGVTKACLDALVRGGWLEDDDSEHVVSVTAEVVVVKGVRALVIELAHAAQDQPREAGRVEG